MAIDVRPARRQDAAPIHDLARESWHAAYGEFLPEETVEKTIAEWYAIEELETGIEEAAGRDDAAFVVAERDGDLVGFAHAGPHGDQPGAAGLYRIYVRPDSWDGGIGSAALERIETALAGEYGRLRLAVFADNEVGVSFYETAGFDRVETRPSDLAEGLDEYVYEKAI